MTKILPQVITTPTVSNVKNNVQRPHIANSQAVDSIVKIGEASDPKAIPTKMLLSLMKSGLNGEKADTKAFVGRTYEDWVNMYNMAHDNSVMPLTLEGLKKTPEIKVPDDVKANMEINAEFVKNYHGRQEAILRDFTKMTAAKGIDTVQMKGIGFSLNYPNPQGRYGGDLDVFNYKHGTDPTDAKNNMSLFVDKLAEKSGIRVDTNHTYKHSEIIYKGMPIENHRVLLNVKTSPLQKKMNDYLLKVLNPHQEVLPHGTKVLVPSKEFNNIFISFHAMQHYSGGNANFHHLADWAVQIKKHGMQIPEEIKGTQFEKFMYALTNLANKHLGTNVKVPENKKLEDKIFKGMMHSTEIGYAFLPEKPKTKNPITLFKYECKRFVAVQAHAKECFGNEARGLTRAFFDSLLEHMKNPKSFAKFFSKIV